MTSKYDINLVKKQFIKSKDVTRSHFDITKKSKAIINMKEVRNIYNSFVERGIEPSRIGMVGLNGERYTTIKGPKQVILEDYEDDQYLNGKSSEIKEKLSEFHNIQLIIY